MKWVQKKQHPDVLHNVMSRVKLKVRAFDYDNEVGLKKTMPKAY